MFTLSSGKMRKARGAHLTSGGTNLAKDALAASCTAPARKPALASTTALTSYSHSVIVSVTDAASISNQSADEPNKDRAWRAGGGLGARAWLLRRAVA